MVKFTLRETFLLSQKKRKGNKKMAQPIFKKKVYPVEIAIFQNQKGYSISLQKIRKNKETDKYEYENLWFFKDELVKLKEVVEEASHFMEAEENGNHEISENPQENEIVSSDNSIDSIDDEIPF